MTAAKITNARNAQNTTRRDNPPMWWRQAIGVASIDRRGSAGAQRASTNTLARPGNASKASQCNPPQATHAPASTGHTPRPISPPTRNIDMARPWRFSASRRTPASACG